MKSLLTIGTFDGVHRGHQALLKDLIAAAAKRSLVPHVILFRKPPRYFFNPHSATPLLTTVAERTALLKKLGVRRVTALNFDKSWAAMHHEVFFERFLLRKCRAGGLIVGPDFAFGKGRQGSSAWLAKACAAAGVYFKVSPIVRRGRDKISSSAIRKDLLEGNVESAARQLGRPYSISGRVVRGKGLGGQIGIPTANLEVPQEKILPLGVFKATVAGPKKLGGHRVAVCNIGTRPTVDTGKAVHVEAHIPGFSGDLYGSKLTLRFERKIRGESRFPSLQALISQIRRDIRSALRD